MFYSAFTYSQNFVKTWQQCYGGSANDRVSSIIPYKGGYLFFGSTHSTDGDITVNNCDGVGHGAAWLVNINNSGEIIFDSCYCGYSGASGRKIINIGKQGNFYATGSSGPNNTGGINGYWIAKADTNFNIIWQDVLGGTYVEDPRGGCVAHDGGIIMSGITGSPDGDIEEHFGSFDNWLVKMNADGSHLFI